MAADGEGEGESGQLWRQRVQDGRCAQIGQVELVVVSPTASVDHVLKLHRIVSTASLPSMSSSSRTTVRCATCLLNLAVAFLVAAERRAGPPKQAFVTSDVNRVARTRRGERSAVDLPAARGGSWRHSRTGLGPSVLLPAPHAGLVTELNGTDAASGADAGVIGLPALVRLEPPVEVQVVADDEWWPGLASAYRGRRVSVSWSKGPGMRYLTWEPAKRIRRT